MTAAKIEQIPRLADDAGRVAIIAGNGLLPISVAEALEAAEKKPFLVPLRGEADPVLYKYEHQEISIVEFAKLVRSMKAAGVDRVVLAGGVTSFAFIYTPRRCASRIFSCAAPCPGSPRASTES